MIKQEQGIEKQSPKLELPENPEVTKNLQSKLKEHKQRFKGQKEKFMQYNNSDQENVQLARDKTDTSYKIAICERLLLNGELDIQELQHELEGGDTIFVPDLFENATRVIEDYLKTGGKKNSGGTGFGDKKISIDEITKMKDEQSAKDQVEIKKIRAELNGGRTDSPKPDIQQIEKLKEEIAKDNGMLGLYKYEKKQDKVDALDKRIKEKTAELNRLQTGSEKPISDEEEATIINEITTENAIQGVESLADLYKIIAHNKISLTGSDGFVYSPEKLLSLIQEVAGGQKSIDHITSTMGLRRKLQEIMEIEKIKSKTKNSAEGSSVKGLVDYDEKYFHSISEDGENEWSAIGMENCKNQKYYTVVGENDVKLGIVGVYDTEDEQNITHIVIDPKFRGKGLLQKFYNQLIQKENLPFLTATINISNTASVKSHEKAGFEKVSDKKYEEQFHKYKYKYTKK